MTDPARFRTTHWSVVLAAGGDGVEARTALATLCSTYWYPLYAFARRRGRNADDASDLVQGFLCELLEKGWVKRADEARGRFRGFLATAFRRYMARRHEHDSAQKRGGGRALLSIDTTEGEERFAREPADDRTPEQAFDRQWAQTVIDRAVERVRSDYVRRGRAADFDALAPFLDGSSPQPSQADIAERIGTTPGAVKVAVHRLKKRFRDVLRAEVRETVHVDDDVDAELSELLAALG